MRFSTSYIDETAARSGRAKSLTEFWCARAGTRSAFQCLKRVQQDSPTHTRCLCATGMRWWLHHNRQTEPRRCAVKPGTRDWQPQHQQQKNLHPSAEAQASRGSCKGQDWTTPRPRQEVLLAFQDRDGREGGRSPKFHVSVLEARWDLACSRGVPVLFDLMFWLRPQRSGLEGALWIEDSCGIIMNPRKN